MNTKEDVLKSCTVNGNFVTLPAIQLERGLYQEVAKSLNLIGGKWKGGKISAFVFDENPANLLMQIANGNKRDLKKEFQFFGTPDKLANKLVDLAGIEEYDLVLEPSAGQGSIIKAIHLKHKVDVHYCELMPINRTFLEKINNTIFLRENFLTLPKNKSMIGLFHKIIANPPFSKNQDIDHIYAMWECLAADGRIVTIASNHWQNSSNKKEMSFKKWLSEIDAEIIPLNSGEFKESGTAIATCIIIINK